MKMTTITRNRFSPMPGLPICAMNRYGTLDYHPMKNTKKKGNEISLISIVNAFMKKCTKQPSQTMTLNNITIRKVLIEKMRKVISKLHYSSASYHLSLYLMDIIREKGRTKLTSEEIALGSLFLAIKFIELNSGVPHLKAIQLPFESLIFYSYEALRRVEITCLKIIDYNLNLSTPYSALELIISRGMVFANDFPNDALNIMKTKVSQESCELLDKIIKKTNAYIKFNPFLLSLSIVCIVREKNDLPKWNEAFTFYYSIVLKELKQTIEFINEIIIEPKIMNHGKKYATQDVIVDHFNSNNDSTTQINNMKRKKIQVNKAYKARNSSCKILKQRHSNESNYKKSQRSTSASLDDTPKAIMPISSTRLQKRTNSSNSVSGNAKKKVQRTVINYNSNNIAGPNSSLYNPLKTITSRDNSKEKTLNKQYKVLITESDDTRGRSFSYHKHVITFKKNLTCKNKQQKQLLNQQQNLISLDKSSHNDHKRYSQPKNEIKKINNNRPCVKYISTLSDFHQIIFDRVTRKMNSSRGKKFKTNKNSIDMTYQSGKKANFINDYYQIKKGDCK